ncbi:MAG TPA: ribbon-helix-helix protein, CopG family [Terracidiphilus sp.]|nr:ribbon-helix-helix protein, CopG family [Terracidiphilus sp.]
MSKEKPKVRLQRERVLIEFPVGLLQQADEAARKLNRNRSELIRSAVKHFLNEMEAKRFEERLAAAYAANSNLNLELSKEFEAVDREGF